jgi:hypothetical protein
MDIGSSPSLSGEEVKRHGQYDDVYYTTSWRRYGLKVAMIERLFAKL